MLGIHSRTSSFSTLGWVPLLLALLGALLGIGGLSYLITFAKYRFAIAVTVSLLLIALAVVNIRAAIIGTLVYLVFMGDIRRMLIPSVGWSGEDPLLLIAPAFAIIVFAYAWSSEAIKINTPLAGWILALMGVMMLQMLNPRQGGLVVGVAGALFYLVPLLWYWIGRTYATPGYLHQVLFSVVIPLGGLAAAFGLYQTFYGFPLYQQIWIEDIIASPFLLGSEGIEKPFSFFASPTEHDNFILSALAILVATLIYRRQYSLLLLIVPMIVIIFLGGSRGPVAKLLVTSAGLWAVFGTNTFTWVMRGLFALGIGILGLTWGLSSIDPGSAANERVAYRIERQQRGFGSTETHDKSGIHHLRMIAFGLKEGVTRPLGLGLGAATKAGMKYGGVGGSTEGDLSDVFRSTGLVGGVIYLIIMVLIIRSAFQYWTQTRSLLALSIAGVLAINIFLWLMGGQYAMSALVWFLIGALDRFQNTPNDTDPEEPDASPDDSEATAPDTLPPQFSPRVPA